MARGQADEARERLKKERADASAEGEEELSAGGKSASVDDLRTTAAARAKAARDMASAAEPPGIKDTRAKEREQSVMAALLGHPALEGVLSEDQESLCAKAKRMLWRDSEAPGAFDPLVWAKRTAAEIQPPPPAAGDVPSQADLARICTEAATRQCKVLMQGMVSREEMEDATQEGQQGQQAVMNAVNSLNATGKGKRLHKASALTVRMIDKYTTAIKQCKQLGNEVPEALTALLKDEQAKYKRYALIAAKVDSGGLEVLEYFEESEFFDKETHEDYLRMEKLMQKDKKRRLESSRGGAQYQPQHQPQYQPQYQQQFQQYLPQPPPILAPIGGQAQGFGGQGLGAQPGGQQQFGSMGRGRSMVKPAWMTQGAGGGAASFVQHAAGLRLKSSSGKMVHFPGDRNLAAPPHSAGAGGAFPNSNTCWFCGTAGHEAFECGQLRGYFAAGKIDVQGHPSAEFQL